jgi:hypothetical protein
MKKERISLRLSVKIISKRLFHLFCAQHHQQKRARGVEEVEMVVSQIDQWGKPYILEHQANLAS